MEIRRIVPLALAALLAVPVAAADGDLIATINGIRERGCDGRPAAAPPLRQNSRLDRAAAALASGQGLRDALRESGYRAARSAMLEVTGNEPAVGRWLAADGCAEIADPEFREVGVARRGKSVWILIAVPKIPPAAGDAPVVARRVLELVNEARTQPRRCGWKRFDAAPPVAASEMLQRAALAHARDMANRSELSHSGSDGSSAGERATRAGYPWRIIGENIAAGQVSAESVVEDWIASPRHCANLMRADFTEMGVAFAAYPASAAGIYWDQLFAAPRP